MDKISFFFLQIKCFVLHYFTFYFFSFRSEEDSPNDYESSSHSEEERPSTQWPSVIVYPYSETKVEQNVGQLGAYDEAITHPARRG